MILKEPLNIDGVVYDRLVINLAVSTNYNSNNESDLSLALRLVPARVDDNNSLVTNDSKAIGIYRGRVGELQDTNEVDFVENLVNSLTNLVNSKL